jgi:hypothetical protein
MKDYLRYYQLISIRKHHKLISLSQGDFGDDSPKVPASEVNTTKNELAQKRRALSLMSSTYMERLDRLLAYSSGKNHFSIANKH